MEKERKQSRDRNGDIVISKKLQVEEWLKKLRMQTTGWRNKNDPHCLTVTVLMGTTIVPGAGLD